MAMRGNTGFGETFGPTRPVNRQDLSSGVAADLIDLMLPLWQRARETDPTAVARPGGAPGEPSEEMVTTTLALAQLWDMVSAWEAFWHLTHDTAPPNTPGRP